MYIVSLLPAATEIVFALGGGDDVVGVSHECDHPSEARERPVVTRPRVGAPSGSEASGTIERSIRDLVRDALAIYEIDVDRLRAAKPDVVITQDLCAVCAVAQPDVHAALATLTGTDVRIVSLSPLRLADIFADIRTVADAIDREATKLLAALETRVQTVRTDVARLDAPRPVVATIEWLDPVYLGGTWMPELVTAAGGIPCGPGAGEKAPPIDGESFASLRPDVVLIKPCGFDLARTECERDLIATLLPATWPAVRDERVFVADGNAYFNRPGPRIVDSLEILAAALFPHHFDSFVSHYGDDVRRIDRHGEWHPFAP